MNAMKKIIVVGCPGAGKSTLANKLGKELDIPVYHLDDWQDLPDADFMKKQTDIMKEETWILDGNFTKSIAHRLSFADTVIYLDFSKPVIYFRMFKRFLRKPGFDLLNLALIKYVWSFPSQKIQQIIHSGKTTQSLFIFHNPKEVSAFIKNFPK